MRRVALVGLGWLAGTLTAVGVGVQAVDVVTASVTGERPAPLSAGAVRAALTESEAPTTGPPPTTPVTGADGTTPTTGGATRTTRPPTPAPSPTPVTTGRSATTTTTSVNAGPEASTSTSTTARTSPTSPTGPTTSTTRPSTAPAEERTYQLTGGSVGVRFENGKARLLWATPAAGFRADSSGSDSQVDVRFRSKDHESRLRAFWRDGPQAEIEEREA